MKSNKRILTCAITGGIHTPTLSDYLPVTKDQIADGAIEAAEAGASVVHIHARNDHDGSPSAKLEDFEYIINRIKAHDENILICITTGGGLGMTIDQRTAVLPKFRPEIATMNAGSINWGLFPLAYRYKDTDWKYEWEKPYFEATRQAIFQNSFGDMEIYLKKMKDSGSLPELECYDVGHLYNVKFMQDSGWLPEGKLYLQFVHGINGALGTAPEDLVTMKQTADRLFGPDGYVWSAFGAGRFEYPIATQAMFMGGHFRVGLEDNLYLSKGVKAKSNAELVTKMIRIMNEFDVEVASHDEARSLLGLK